MAEKLNIVQSATEPDKNNIWLKDNELKKFGAKGWSTIGISGGNVCKVIIDFNTPALVNYSEVFNAIVSRSRNTCFVAEVKLEDSIAKVPVLCAAYIGEGRIRLFLPINGNSIIDIIFSTDDGGLLNIGQAVIPKPISLHGLATGATLEEVVSAYNNLVDQLVESGLANKL